MLGGVSAGSLLGGVVNNRAYVGSYIVRCSYANGARSFNGDRPITILKVFRLHL